MGENEPPPHRYKLCCVIMHLGGTMASGHYIAYVKAAEPPADYLDCPRDLPKGSLSAGSSEKTLNLLNKLLKPGSFVEGRNGLAHKSVVQGVRVCKGIDCCGVRTNRTVLEDALSGRRRRDDDLWLECDDENVRAITTEEFVEELSFKPNSTSTPYLLFYAKISD